MSQTRLGSLVEVCTNVAIGYVVALMTQLVVFPLFDMHVSMGEHIMIGVLFTVVSIVRSYIVRRVFDNLGLFRKDTR